MVILLSIFSSLVLYCLKSPFLLRLLFHCFKKNIRRCLTRSRCENCLAKSSKAIQNSPSLRTRTERSSLSRSDSESHSQLRSLQGPFHSPLPQGFRSLTRWVSPKKDKVKYDFGLLTNIVSCKCP